MKNRLSFTWATLLFLNASTAMIHGETTLAYVKEGTICTAAADGTHARKICVGDAPCISGDGRLVAYTKTLTTTAKSKDADPVSIRRVVVRELSSGKEATVSTVNTRETYGPLWSPGGEWIAFNLLAGDNWQVAVAHPDGTGFHVLTDQWPQRKVGYSLAGWNRHDNAILVQDLTTMTEIDPEKSRVIWQRPVEQLTGEKDPSSDLRCDISADGKMLVATRYVETDEFKNLDGPSSYLVLTNFPDGKPRRVTPRQFDAFEPWLDHAGETIFLRGFRASDVKHVKGSEETLLKTRIYRFDIRSGRLTALVEGGSSPSVSHD